MEKYYFVLTTSLLDEQIAELSKLAIRRYKANGVEELKKNECKFYFDEDRSANSFKEFLATKSIESVLNEHPYADWNQEWRKHFKPIQISKELEIIPSFMKDSYNSTAKKSVFIYPGQGFGTGNHESTFLCLQLLTEINIENNRCLDFGCGSGILGLAFTQLGGRNVDFFDIDNDALENLKQNISLNFSHDFKIFNSKENSKIALQYDLIFANILYDVLLQEKNFLIDRLAPNGHLILSGLLQNQVDDIERSYKKSSNLHTCKIIHKGEWSTILLEKK